MKKSTDDNTKARKKRPPVTGELVGVRVQPEMLEKLDNWRREQPDLPGRPEAIRRLIEIGLGAERSHPPGPHSGASRAAEMAATQIDQMGDASASDDERRTRKRRVLKGPPEFVEGREDQTKPKTKR